MAHTFLTQFAYGQMVLTCGLAALKGGLSERWGAAVIFAAWAAQIVLSMILGAARSDHVLELTLLAVDAVLAVSLLALSLRFVKIWLGLAMLIQSVELGLHGAVMGDFGLPVLTYLIANNVASFSLLALLLFATLAAWRERVVKGRLASSRTSLGPSEPALPEPI